MLVELVKLEITWLTLTTLSLSLDKVGDLSMASPKSSTSRAKFSESTIKGEPEFELTFLFSLVAAVLPYQYKFIDAWLASVQESPTPPMFPVFLSGCLE